MRERNARHEQLAGSGDDLSRRWLLLFALGLALACSGCAGVTASNPSGGNPPTLSNVAATNLSSTAATITWLTNLPATSQVDYGTTPAYGSTTPLDSNLLTSHSQALSGLQPSTLYHFRVRSRDANNLEVVSPDSTFTTTAQADTTPPTLSAVTATNLTPTSATITWTTNEPADSQVEYGTTTSYGQSTPLNSAMVTSHPVSLTGLTPSTLYHYRVKSKDAAGNPATSNDFTFTTGNLPPPPIISNVAASNITLTSATITWATDKPADSQVEYGTTTSYGFISPLDASLVTSHSVVLSGLQSGTLYHYRVRSKDAAGSIAVLGDFTFTTTGADTTPPLISNVASSNVAASGATISWTTDEPSDSQVEYGLTTSYGSQTALNINLVTLHSQGLSGLTASTLYHFRVKSKDGAGNPAVSGDFTFTTTTSVAITVLPTVETDPSHHTGDTADDSAIWIHPTDTSLSLVIGDDKNGGLMVWGLNGKEIQYVAGTNYNNLDLRYNFPLVGRFSNSTSHQTVALLGVGNELGNKIDFFKVNPTARQLEPAGSIATANGLIPYGSCMYHSPVSGKYYYFVNAITGVTQQWELRDGGNGQVAGTMVREFDVGSQVEGCVADDVLAHFYIGEERVGIWKYGAEPGDGNTRTLVDKTGTGGHLTADVEGLAIYYTSDNKGYLIASSQGNSTLVVYTREGNNPFLGSFRIVAGNGIDEVTSTDGLDVTNFPMGGGFSGGLFVAHDSFNSGATASNHKFVPWDSIANALALTIDISWDPRLVGK